MITSLVSILLVVIGSVIGAFGGFVFKGAAKNIGLNIGNLLKNYKLIFGFVLYGLSATIYIIALTHGELNVLYPISSLTYIWSTILAKIYLKEEINSYKWIGVSLIVAGSIFIVN